MSSKKKQLWEEYRAAKKSKDMGRITAACEAIVQFNKGRAGIPPSQIPKRTVPKYPEAKAPRNQTFGKPAISASDSKPKDYRKTSTNWGRSTITGKC
ncbi:hypothetical protein [Vibrio breoganii]|uniref:hypothetical protein n=1 Tax=Vibrio breoganii TaxID=553239 RepID=UPI000C83506C|nr:hypothetical protein [Vibrio breoganii]PMG05354.1 hypothetical protein BCV00_13020 [Vibrio breoganii]PMG99559.1 hypothetical protein BCU79_18670 [Vibrio breoganii]